MSKYKRVLLKLSGEALAGSQGRGFDEKNVLAVGEQVKKLVDNGIEVAIVIGGGNFWRGRSSDSMDRTKADEIGMLATVMNCLYTSAMFRTIGLEAVVQTPFLCGNMTDLFRKETALDHMAKGTVVFFAGGTGHPYFSTDTGAALRAVEIEADIILLAKNVDGVYDADPNVDSSAKKYEEISLKEVIRKDLKVMDLTAATLCAEQKMPMMVFHLNADNSIVRAADGENIGTTVTV